MPVVHNVIGARASTNTVQSVIGARTSYLQPVFNVAGARAQSIGLVYNVVGARATNNTVMSIRGARASSPKVLKVCVGARAASDSQVTGGPQITVGGTTRFPSYDDFVKGKADVANYTDGYSSSYTAIYNGTSYPIDTMIDFHVKLKDSMPMEWSIHLVDTDGQTYDPRHNSGSWQNILGNRPFNSDRITYNRQLVATINYAGRTFVYNGIPDKTEGGGSGDTRVQALTWSGHDHSMILFRKMQTFPTVRTQGMAYSASLGTSTPQTFIASDVQVADLCNAVGIEVNLIGLDRFVIPVQHRQNTDYMSIIKEILDVPVCEWNFFGSNVFTVYHPNNTSTYRYNFGTDGSGNVGDVYYSYKWEKDLKVTYNKAIFSRLQEAGAVTYLNATDFKQYTINFPVPVNRLRWHVFEASGGQFAAFEFFAGDALMATSNLTPNPIGGIGYPLNLTVGAGTGSGNLNGITRVEVTWGAQPGVEATSGYGRMVFIGTPNGQVDWGAPGWNDTFSYTVFNPGADPALGEMGVEHIQTPIIPTYEWLVLHALRWIFNYGAQETAVTRKVPLNPAIQPGMTLTESVPGYPNVDYYIPEVEHNFSDIPENRWTQYNGIQYDTSIYPISPYDWILQNAAAFQLVGGALGAPGAD